MKKPTAQQLLIFEFVKDSLLEKGYPPSVREICDGVGLSSTSTVHGHLMRLEAAGMIKRDPTKPRAIEIVGLQELRNNEIVAPILGNITAGSPILAHQNIQGYMTVPGNASKSKDVFILKVQGDSMIEAGILSGDNIIIQKDVLVLNGDIVAAMITDDASGECSATVKRFYKENGHIRLQPENSFMQPIFVDDCTILGKVIGLYREF